MESNSKEHIPCVFYLYLHSKLYEGMLTKEVSIKELKEKLFKWKIPRKIRPMIVRELEMLGLITMKGRYLVELKKPKFSEEKCNDYYRILKIF